MSKRGDAATTARRHDDTTIGIVVDADGYYCGSQGTGLSQPAPSNAQVVAMALWSSAFSENWVTVGSDSVPFKLQLRRMNFETRGGIAEGFDEREKRRDRNGWGGELRGSTIGLESQSRIGRRVSTNSSGVSMLAISVRSARTWVPSAA